MYVAQNSNPPRAVNMLVGPVVPRRRRRGAPLGAFVSSRFLKRYPNGAPLDERLSLTGYKSAPLRRFTNGQPLSDVGGGNVPKAMLVMMAFNRAMKNKRGCGRGLGDDGSDDDGSGIISVPSVVDEGSDNSAYTVPSVVGGDSTSTQSVWSESPNVPGVPTGTASPATNASTLPSALSNLLSTLFRPTTYASSVPAYSTFGTGLAAPAWAGAPVSIGGLLTVAGVGLFVIMLAKKR